MDISEDWHAALAALAWQVDLGVTEVIGDAPLNRYDLPEAAKPLPRITATAVAAAPAALPPEDPLTVAERQARAAASLSDLRAALEAFDHCELKRGARNLVFAEGNPMARVLILTDAPGRDEDLEGRPIVGRAGDLLDKMFAAIGLSRAAPDPAAALYIAPVIPWRTPQDRDPSPTEIALLHPFVLRHIVLVNPAVIVVMGNAPLQALLNNSGIQRARGQWAQTLGKPVLAMNTPSYLLRTPTAKRDAWADLLALKAKLIL